MTRFPHTARKWLAARQRAEADQHPDAGLLTAFAERSLSEKERGTVLQHLAACPQCREIVSLSVPEPEAVFLPEKGASRPRLTWPVLRWGAVAASVAVVAIAVGLYFRTPGEQVARSTQTSETAAFYRSEKPAETKSAEEAATRSQAPAEGTASPRQPRDEDRAAVGFVGGRQQSQLADQAAIPKAQPLQEMETRPDRAAAAAEKVEIAQEPAAPPVEAEATKANEETALAKTGPANEAAAQDALAANRASAAPPAPAAPELRKKKLAAGAAATAESAVITAPARFAEGETGRELMRTSPDAVWSVSETRKLRRSFDSGQNWQEVPVSTSDRMEKDDKDGQPSFRMVSAQGPLVWAATSGNVLYYSRDGGAHWKSTRIAALPSGQTISQIAILSPEHVRVTASGGELWETTDGGRTWRPVTQR